MSRRTSTGISLLGMSWFAVGSCDSDSDMYSIHAQKKSRHSAYHTTTLTASCFTFFPYFFMSSDFPNSPDASPESETKLPHVCSGKALREKMSIGYSVYYTLDLIAAGLSNISSNHWNYRHHRTTTRFRDICYGCASHVVRRDRPLRLMTMERHLPFVHIQYIHLNNKS